MVKYDNNGNIIVDLLDDSRVISKEIIKDLRVDDKRFISVENDYGTVIYHYPYFNGLRLLNKDVNYYFFFPILLDDERIFELLDNDLSNIENDEGFLDQKTIYKVKGVDK
jgi:hypothetical protein